MHKLEAPSNVLQVMSYDIHSTNDKSSFIRFSNIEDTTNLLFKILLDHPEEARCIWTQGEGTVVLTIKTHPEDVKKLVGRDGATVNAIRTVFHAAFARLGKRSKIMVAD